MPDEAAAIPFKIYGEQVPRTRCTRGSSQHRAVERKGTQVMLERPGVTERLQQIGVRYVVWLGGTTVRKDGGGSVSCVASRGRVPACLGVGWWDKGPRLRRDRVGPAERDRDRQGQRRRDRVPRCSSARLRYPDHRAGAGKACDRMSGGELARSLLGGDLAGGRQEQRVGRAAEIEPAPAWALKP